MKYLNSCWSYNHSENSAYVSIVEIEELEELEDIEELACKTGDCGAKNSFENTVSAYGLSLTSPLLQKSDEPDVILA